MRRREFISLIGGAAVALPSAAHAQQPAMPVIGFLSTGWSPKDPKAPVNVLDILALLRRGLDEAGYVEGQNVAIESRFAEGRYDRLPVLAAELVRRPVAVIAASGTPAAPAAKAATATIPIVFLFAGDPVAAGLVASLNRPGGNVTGVNFMLGELGAKKLELLHALVSNATTIAVLVNPSNPVSVSELTDVEAAAHRIRQEIQILNATNDGDFEVVSATLARQRPGALLVGSDPFFVAHRETLVSLAARHSLPALYPLREFVLAGGLISYGTSLADAFRQVGIYVGRILKGAKPAELPVVQSAKFELVINLKTAKALTLTIPPSLLALADEVVE
jgi:putative tryptophan/tyrosine transport system substrate-binding protein